jgi:hypothetical protein
VTPLLQQQKSNSIKILCKNMEWNEKFQKYPTQMNPNTSSSSLHPLRTPNSHTFPEPKKSWKVSRFRHHPTIFTYGESTRKTKEIHHRSTPRIFTDEAPKSPFKLSVFNATLGNPHLKGNEGSEKIKSEIIPSDSHSDSDSQFKPKFSRSDLELNFLAIRLLAWLNILPVRFHVQDSSGHCSFRVLTLEPPDLWRRRGFKSWLGFAHRSAAHSPPSNPSLGVHSVSPN